MNKYLELDKDNFIIFKNNLIKEINELNIEGLPIIEDLDIIEGSLLNNEYLLNNNKIKLLNDNETYLSKQVECIFNNDDLKSYFSIISNPSFILITEYQDKSNQEIIIYKKR